MIAYIDCTGCGQTAEMIGENRLIVCLGCMSVPHRCTCNPARTSRENRRRRIMEMSRGDDAVHKGAMVRVSADQAGRAVGLGAMP